MDEVPVYSYFELFHGKDWEDPDDGEKSIVCFSSFNGVGYPDPTGLTAEEYINFEMISCAIYEPKEEIFHSALDVVSSV